MRRIAVLAAMIGALLPLFAMSGPNVLEVPPTAEAAETTTDFFYGNNPDGTIGPVGPGQANVPPGQLGLTVQPFCTACYITRIQPDLVYWNDPNPLLTNGMSANYDNSNSEGIWLHHDGLVDVCLRTLFLSGNERTVYQAPNGQGSYIGVPGSPDDPLSCNANWFVTWHIHNNGNVNHNVKLKFTVTYSTGVTLTRLKGVGLNVATATSAEYSIPINYSDTQTCPSNCGPGVNTDHTVTAAEQGQIIQMGGHVHDFGISVAAENVTRGQWLCTSLGGYGANSYYWPTGGPGTPGHPVSANQQTMNNAYHQPPPSGPDNRYHIQNMSLCNPAGMASVLCTGDVLRLHTQYNNGSGAPIGDAMGIMQAALAATPPDTDGDGTWDGCETTDLDNDGYKDRVEALAGTNLLSKCGVNAWPADINNDGFSDGTDITMLAGWFGKAVPTVPARGDIADPPDGFVDGTDITSIAGHFGKPCGP